MQVDVRSEQSVQQLFQRAQQLGEVRAVVYNAGAVWWAPLADTPTKRFDLLHEINCRGLYFVIQQVRRVYLVGAAAALAQKRLPSSCCTLIDAYRSEFAGTTVSCKQCRFKAISKLFATLHANRLRTILGSLYEAGEMNGRKGARRRQLWL